MSEDEETGQESPRTGRQAGREGPQQSAHAQTAPHRDKHYIGVISAWKHNIK